MIGSFDNDRLHQVGRINSPNGEGNMDYKWKPIAPLSVKERQIDVSDVDSLKGSWLDFRDRLGASSPQNLVEFNERLARKWSIETGMLERIYDIDRGTTIVLIERGFFAGLVERSGTDKDPEQLIEVLRDHKVSRGFTAGLCSQFETSYTRPHPRASLDPYKTPTVC